MATSSIYDKVKMRDRNAVEAFINAIEESENASKVTSAPKRSVRMATKEDTIRLHEMRKKRRTSAG